jgi:hypothetical protein
MGERDSQRKSNSTKIISLNKVGQAAIWEKGTMTEEREHHRLPLKGGCGPEAELLAKLVALHMSTHPAGVIEGSLAFQKRLNSAMAGGPFNEIGMNA